MHRRIKAHFDGNVFVPDEGVELPMNQPVTVEPEVSDGTKDRPSVRERDEALVRFLSQPLNGKGLPDWAMDREYMYEDRD